MSKAQLQQMNFLEYFIHEYIFFSHDFVFELKLEPQQTVQHLKDKLFPDASLSLYKASNNKVKVFRVTKNQNLFRLAEVKGLVFDDKGLPQIQFTAKVLTGIWIWLIVGSFLCSMASLISWPDMGAGITALLTGLASLGLWIYSVRERNALIELMRNSIIDIEAK